MESSSKSGRYRKRSPATGAGLALYLVEKPGDWSIIGEQTSRTKSYEIVMRLVDRGVVRRGRRREQSARLGHGIRGESTRQNAAELGPELTSFTTFGVSGLRSFKVSRASGPVLLEDCTEQSCLHSFPAMQIVQTTTHHAQKRLSSFRLVSCHREL